MRCDTVPMRRLLSLILLALAAPAHADERSVMIASFERLRVNGPYTVRVTTGGSPSARAEGDPRVLDRVSIRSEGGTLVISAGVNTWGEQPRGPHQLPVIEVRAQRLRSALVLGGGTVTIDRMSGPRVDVSISGAGSLDVLEIDAERLDAAVLGTGRLALAGRANEARFQANGPAAIAAERLVATTLRVSTEGLGEGRFAARSTAAVNAIGGGAITVSGSAACTVRGNAPVICGRAPR